METVEINLLTIDAGPDGVRHPGRYIVGIDEAKALVNANCAEYTSVKPPAPFTPAQEKAVFSPQETSVKGKVVSAPETPVVEASASPEVPQAPWG